MPSEVAEADRAELGEQVEGSVPQKPYVCKICGQRFDSQQGLAAHIRTHKRESGGAEGGAGGRGSGPGGEAEQIELPRPWEISVIEEAIEFLEERLPKVHGVERYDKLIIGSLREDPRPLINPSALHAFIKSIAPRAYDSHLTTFVVNPLYVKFPNLPQAVARYLQSSSQEPGPALIWPYAPAAQPIAPYYPQSQIYPVYGPVYPVYHQYYQPAPPYAPPPPPPRPPRTYKIVVDGQEIETDEAGYMAWQRFLREREEQERRRQEHELTMKKLEVEIKRALEEGKDKSDDELSRKLDEISRKLEEERERRHQAELELLKREIDELKRRPGLLEELTIYEQIAERLGFKRGGRTTMDLLESFVERLDQRAAQLLSKIPPAGGEWRPEIKRTPEERARKAEEIMRRLEKSEEIMKLEEELIRAASRVRPRQERGVVGGEGKA